MRPDDRIAKLRDAVRSERLLIAALRHKITDANFKASLDKPSSLLDDVNGVFLDRAALNESRSDVAWSNWLTNAETVLQDAVGQREYIEGLVEKFGPDARTVG